MCGVTMKSRKEIGKKREIETKTLCVLHSVSFSESIQNDLNNALQ